MTTSPVTDTDRRNFTPPKRTPLSRLSIGVVLFTVLALGSGIAVYSVVTNAAVRDDRTYSAMFRNVSGLRDGADVQVAGVTVGQVSSLDLASDGLVEVEFTLADSVPITRNSTAVVRYKDLLGRRVLEIQPGDDEGELLQAGGTIPAAQTTPALDLDQLYSGFGPLFEGLDADKLNQLSSSLITVMQGQGQDFEDILGRAATLTDSIGDRDEVIGALVSNLDEVLDTVERRTPQTNRLVIQLQQLVTGLSGDRAALGTALQGIAGSTDEITRLIARVRPELRDDLREVKRLSQIVNADEDQLDELLRHLPGHYALVGRVGIYQSAFQFYLCGVQLRLAAPGGATVMTEMTRSQERRCQS